ncbi:anthranilate synthase component II [Anaeromicropila herbilytica]|uniref:Aminodeoxychorismate/anthranilate synthase component II n=1 Tax=Anaeromicropila herbilytica TaxID=2785025 RepID=A0A7R7EP75_9FIRM|nr:aminodeoxychorismate/anthranilate synthase component II [Anaeromicropila herbilytica]BCN32501.1 aminodeoxychorismate/anthranilate synthase component II [Anaeromicropila herbilytica]
MILLIDNYDSFTFNLYQYIGIFTPDIKVVRNDKITIEEIEELNPEKIILSPGPKSPNEAGICIQLIEHFYNKKPILGVCLGHQCIGAAFGGTVTHAKSILHGKQSVIQHDGTSIFGGIHSPIKIARYHSLAVMAEDLPKELKVLAVTEDGEIMAMKHNDYPVVGLQFHPESIFTEHGKRLIENFVNGAI